MARKKEVIAKELGAEMLRAMAQNMSGIFSALDDNKVSFFEGLSMGGTLLGSLARLAPLIQEAKAADWDEHDIEPLLLAIADELEN